MTMDSTGSVSLIYDIHVRKLHTRYYTHYVI